MKYSNALNLLIFVLIAPITLISCARVTWGAFTTTKDNIENIPNVFEQYLGSPSTNKIRVFEYDKDKYMGLFIVKNSGNGMTIESAKSQGVNIILPSDPKFTIDKNKTAVATNVKGYQFIQYTPSPGEDETITAFYIMEALNKLQNNKKIEAYSQTHDTHTKQFLFVNK